MNLQKVNLQEKFGLVNEHWQPKIVGALNGQHVKLAKVKGDFVWHKHDHEDELFMVIKGELTIEFRDSKVHLMPGEFLIVPRGVEHRPIAEKEVELLLFEPATTVNTGDQKKTEKTAEDLEWI